MGKFLDTRKASGIAIATGASILLVALVAYGATTISSNIVTGGSLDVSGASTLTSATLSTTLSVTGNATFDTNTMFVDAANNRVGVSTITPNTRFEVVGADPGTAATAASTTGLIVGGNSSNGLFLGMIFGTCNLAQATITASTTRGLVCSSATGINTGFKVFVQATSTLTSGLTALPANGISFAIVSASSTGSNTIGVDVSNISGADNVPRGTLNFWAFR